MARPELCSAGQSLLSAERGAPPLTYEMNVLPKQNRGEKWVLRMASSPALLHRDFAPFRPPQPPPMSRVRPYTEADRTQGQAGDEAWVLLRSNPAQLFLFARIPTASPLCPGPHLAPVLPPRCSHVPPLLPGSAPTAINGTRDSRKVGLGRECLKSALPGYFHILAV